MNRTLGRLMTAAALAVSIGITGLAPAAHAAPSPSSSTMNTHATMSAPDRAAIDTEARAFLANSIDKTPGLWLAVWDPKRGYYEQAYGKASLDGTPATVKDHFLIGSITKTVFATA
ncbi:MAG: serine hydrolase, partial [Candidatus Nanopelagicales bacterium]|nr:serine hydrolase [Candidatus Nanopelagicales bacterium]